MGAWDVDSFGNDDACDWLFELEEAPDYFLIEETLDKVIGAVEIKGSLGEQGIAAAEVVARLQGHWGKRDPLSESADEWVEAQQEPPPAELAKKAHAAIARILGPGCELNERWRATDEHADWVAAVEDLKSRIKL